MMIEMILTFRFDVVTRSTQIVIITNQTFVTSINEVRFQTGITWNTSTRRNREDVSSRFKKENIDLPICDDIDFPFARSFFLSTEIWNKTKEWKKSKFDSIQELFGRFQLKPIKSNWTKTMKDRIERKTRKRFVFHDNT